MNEQLTTAINDPEKIEQLEDALVEMYVAWSSKDDNYPSPFVRENMGLHFSQLRDIVKACQIERENSDSLKLPRQGLN